MKHSNPYIRKKALCTAVRVIQRAPECCPDYFKVALLTLEDSAQGHGPVVAAVQLLNVICRANARCNKRMKKHLAHILNRLNGLLRSNYNPDHDIGGVTDPFLQVHLLELLRTVTRFDKKMPEDVSDTLTQIATSTESNKNPGNAVLYECVRTIMCIETQSPVHRLAVNILGKFLLNRDNNIRSVCIFPLFFHWVMCRLENRYVALNALCNVVRSNTEAIQRHRNQIKDCLKDADVTIRHRALDLIYALTNEENIKDLVSDLLKYLDMSASEPDFQQDLAAKICMVVEKYAPTRRWHIDTVAEVMAKVGSMVMDDTITNMFVIVSNTPRLQAYAVYKLYHMVVNMRIESDPLKRLTAWCIGEYGAELTRAASAQKACVEQSMRFKAVTSDEVVHALVAILDDAKSHTTTRAYVLTALLKLSKEFGGKHATAIKSVYARHGDCAKVELQQRSVEFSALQSVTEKVKDEVLKAMPVPSMVRFEESKSPSDDEKQAAAAAAAEDTSSSESSDVPVKRSSKKRGSKKRRGRDVSSDEGSSSSSSRARRKRRRSKSGKSGSKRSSRRGSDDEDSSSAARRRRRRRDRKKSTSRSRSPQDDSRSKRRERKKKKAQDVVVPRLDMPGSASAGPVEAPTGAVGGLDITGGMFDSPEPQQKKKTAGGGGGGGGAGFGNLLDFDANNGNGHAAGAGGGAAPMGALDDILGLAAVAPAPVVKPAVQRPAASSLPTAVAFDKDGVNVTFQFGKSNQAGVALVKAVFTNNGSQDVNDFAFMVAVPKYMTVDVKPTSGHHLAAFAGNSQNQKFRLVNNMYGSKPLVIKIQVSYANSSGQKIQERTTFKDFPQ